MPVEADLPTRINDGKCDQGCFVFGTKHDVEKAEKISGFYRLNLDLSLERLPPGECAILNSIAFSPDGSRMCMYFCDSPEREIRVCDYDSFANQRVFVELSDASSEPDGSAVDSDSGLWNAQWGDNSRVVRYDADGSETARIDVPTAPPSCVAFGGPPRGFLPGREPLGTVYITSARVGLDAGAVFIAMPPARGIAEPVFRGHNLTH